MPIYRTFQVGNLMIGLSLSMCIADMIRNNIRMEDVKKIVAATNAPDEQTFDQVLDSYSETYWADFSEPAKKLARRLYKAGKIEQPRIKGQKYPATGEGIWVERESDMPYHDNDVYNW